MGTATSTRSPTADDYMLVQLPLPAHAALRILVPSAFEHMLYWSRPLFRPTFPVAVNKRVSRKHGEVARGHTFRGYNRAIDVVGTQIATFNLAAHQAFAVGVT